ncbi:hypothetical protein E3E26_05650 [Thermococcus sp. LS1]|uniref:hypothetical protein n=1 Tax=Thermococcus sp. LS1 TaxID=1638259 RepID=UPI00143C576C|nr:hypothetical protein [Thermococcus sp. LS1]NJD99266.1 hypothetical protein [Thermococcus sp. LS1]
MIEIIITPLVVYGLLFLLPVIYDEMPRKKADLIAVILYGLFLIPSSFYFTFVSAAVIDSLGIDRHLPDPVGILAVILLASLIFTALVSIPLLLIRKKREIKRPLVLLFLASFFFDLVLIGLTGWLKAG